MAIKFNISGIIYSHDEDIGQKAIYGQASETKIFTDSGRKSQTVFKITAMPVGSL
jgi:hypothetical protein